MTEITVKGANTEMKAVRFGDQRFHIHEIGKERLPCALRTMPGSADICLITDSPMTNVIEHLKGDDIAIEKKPLVIQGTLSPMESVWFRDLDGNLIEISYYM